MPLADRTRVRVRDLARFDLRLESTRQVEFRLHAINSMRLYAKEIKMIIAISISLCDNFI
jgi:hypothetical protein